MSDPLASLPDSEAAAKLYAARLAEAAHRRKYPPQKQAERMRLYRKRKRLEVQQLTKIAKERGWYGRLRREVKKATEQT